MIQSPPARGAPRPPVTDTGPPAATAAAIAGVGVGVGVGHQTAGHFPVLPFGSERGAGAPDIPKGQLQLFSGSAPFLSPIVKENR